MTDLEKEVATLGQKEAQWKKREKELMHKETDWEEEKIQLQRDCVEAYEEGYIKAMRQALLFSPNLEPTRFDIDKKIVDDNLMDD